MAACTSGLSLIELRPWAPPADMVSLFLGSLISTKLDWPSKDSLERP